MTLFVTEHLNDPYQLASKKIGTQVLVTTYVIKLLAEKKMAVVYTYSWFVMYMLDDSYKRFFYHLRIGDNKDLHSQEFLTTNICVIYSHWTFWMGRNVSYINGYNAKNRLSNWTELILFQIHTFINI